MKKSLFGGLVALGVFATSSVMRAQPVADHAVIPVAVTLNEIARIHVTDGGNIEFVFNTIDQFKTGIANPGANSFYDSQFCIAASVYWNFIWGAEDPSFYGTEENANTIALNNVGYNFNHTVGVANTCCAAGSDIDASISNAVGAVDGADGTFNGLAQYPLTLMTFTVGASNAGECSDNTFTINWEAGTTSAGGTTAMNAVAFIEQTFEPDRYVTNVFLDLTTP